MTTRKTPEQYTICIQQTVGDKTEDNMMKTKKNHNFNLVHCVTLYMTTNCIVDVHCRVYKIKE